MESGQSKKPNFLIVGAAKAGTTSLAKYLNEHPDVFIPEKKELRFFVKETLLEVTKEDPIIDKIIQSSVLDEKKYFEQFNTKEKLRGEASVHYLFHYHESIPKIKKLLGDIPIVIMLRNPVHRAISNIRYLKHHHNESIRDELNLENERVEKNFNSFWYYKKLGLYSHQVKAFIDNFTAVKIIIFEDFKSNNKGTYKDVLNFLNLSEHELPEYKRYNESDNMSMKKRLIFDILNLIGVGRFLKYLFSGEKLDRMKRKFKLILFRKAEMKLTVQEEMELFDYYKSDIKKLEQILSCELWKN